MVPATIDEEFAVATVWAHPLAAVLDTLADHADASAVGRVRDLQQRWEAGRLRVLIVGEAKRGKSTLGNALLGREVLPSGVTPVTAVATDIVPEDGPEEALEIDFLDGTSSRLPLEDLAGFVTERGNPQNVRRVDRVTVHLRSALDGLGVTLVDTPGVGSALVHNTDEATRAFSRIDAAVFVLTADPPVSASELDLLTTIQRASVRTFLVLNKVDRLDSLERAEAFAYVSGLVPGEHVFACSARDGLAAVARGDEAGVAASGLSDLRDDVMAYLRELARPDLEVSLRRAAGQVAASLLDDAAVECAVLRAEGVSAEELVDQFAARVEELDEQGRERSGQVDWIFRQLRRELDESALETTARLRHDARCVVESVLAANPHAAAGELDDLGREELTTVIGTTVHDWQTEWADRVARRLDETASREEARLVEAHAAMQEAASRFLDVELSAQSVPLERPSVHLVPLDFGPDVGWDLPLPGLSARLLPSGVARGRAIRTLLNETGDLVGRHVGRARSATQAELDRLARTWSRSLTTAYGDAGARFGTLVDRTRDAAGEQRRTRAARLEDAEGRQHELAGLLRDIDATIA